MSFLLDTDICSAYLRQDRNVEGRFLQYGGQLYVSVITVGELFSGMDSADGGGLGGGGGRTRRVS
jgi:predicted nucleic acid-binding protein